MGQGQVFLKGGKEGLALFLSNFFKAFHSFLHLVVTLIFAKLCYAFLKKFLFCHHNFLKKSNSKLLKNEPENIP